MNVAVGAGEIEVVLGDLTEQRTDAIVNAANSSLAHGGGVAGAIVRKGGRVIQDESDRVAPVPVGSAKATGAGALAARWVIHAVGPRMGEGDEKRKLASAVRAALRVAEEIRATSIAFPAISAGTFGYPLEGSASVLTREAVAYLRRDGTTVRRIVFCLYDARARDAFERALAEATRVASS